MDSAMRKRTERTADDTAERCADLTLKPLSGSTDQPSPTIDPISNLVNVLDTVAPTNPPTCCTLHFTLALTSIIHFPCVRIEGSVHVCSSSDSIAVLHPSQVFNFADWRKHRNTERHVRHIQGLLGCVCLPSYLPTACSNPLPISFFIACRPKSPTPPAYALSTSVKIQTPYLFSLHLTTTP